MKYFVEKSGSKIVAKGCISEDVELNPNQIEITKEEYDAIKIGEAPKLTREMINRQVVAKIRERYSIDEEFKMINYGIIDPDNSEYREYRKYVEECRAWGREGKQKYGL